MLPEYGVCACVVLACVSTIYFYLPLDGDFYIRTRFLKSALRQNVGSWRTLGRWNKCRDAVETRPFFLGLSDRARAENGLAGLEILMLELAMAVRITVMGYATRLKTRKITQKITEYYRIRN